MASGFLGCCVVKRLSWVKGRSGEASEELTTLVQEGSDGGLDEGHSAGDGN